MKSHGKESCPPLESIHYCIEFTILILKVFFFFIDTIWVYNRGKWKYSATQKFVHECSKQHGSQQPKVEQLKCPLTVERIDKMWCIHTMEYYSALW